MPRGVESKREREYEEMKEEFEKQGRYKGREEEVAARIVNKQRAEHSETRDARERDREGASPDRRLPIRDYDHLTVEQVTAHLGTLSQDEVREIKAYEHQHRDRKTLLEQLDRRLTHQ